VAWFLAADLSQGSKIAARLGGGAVSLSAISLAP
jgi:hypothetical protein